MPAYEYQCQEESLDCIPFQLLPYTRTHRFLAGYGAVPDGLDDGFPCQGVILGFVYTDKDLVLVRRPYLLDLGAGNTVGLDCLPQFINIGSRVHLDLVDITSREINTPVKSADSQHKDKTADYHSGR